MKATTIRLGTGKAKFKLEKGVRQEDVISPKLSSAVLEYVFKKLVSENKEIRINWGRSTSYFRFANYIFKLQ